jgi:hypothetical protein
MLKRLFERKYVMTCSPILLVFAHLRIFSLLTLPFLVAGCQDVHFSTPFCGPGSVGNTPEASLPDGASGCYAIDTDENFSLNSTILYSKGPRQKQYILLLDNGHELTVGTTTNSPGFSGGICLNPLDQNGDSRITTSFDTGWWQAQYVTFSASRESFSSFQLSFDRDKLERSGIEYILFPAAAFRTTEKDYRPERMLESSLGMTLIRNDSISSKDLMEKIGMTPTPVSMNGVRVDDSFCKSAHLKQMKRRKNDAFTNWKI